MESNQNTIQKNKTLNKLNYENVKKLKNNKQKDNLKQKKHNDKIVNKCNKKLLNTSYDLREIYLKIDEFNNNEKKTIVYFIDNFYPCVDGVLMVMENYVNYMKQFYNIVVCAPRHKNTDLIFNKYFVLYADSIFIKSQGYDLAFPQFDSKFQKFISFLKIDLIHIHSPFTMGYFGLNLAKKRNIPCLTTFHSQFKRDFYDALKNETLATMLTKIVISVYEKSTQAITMNEFSKNLMKEYGLSKNVKIIPNATNIIRQNINLDLEKNILSKFKINKNQFNLLFIGRLVSVKNVYFIMDTLNQLNKINPNFNFIFMGDGPEKQNLEKLSKEYNLNSKIIFTGKILDELEKSIIIKNSNLLFFPSIYDTDGIVKMECACYDVPSLCIKNTGAASNIIDNQNGFLEEAKIESCAKKLDFLIKNVDYVKNIGKNANLEIYKTWDNVCFDLKILYDFYLRKNHFKIKNNK